MGGNLARLPSSPQGGGEDGVPPADLYKIAVDEYRFQAQFNWSRTQYLLAFNAGILAVAVGLASQQGRLTATVFGLGAVAAVLSVFVVKVQHGYYRAARDHMRRIEDQLLIPTDQRLDTTAKLGGRKRTVSVNMVVYLLLGCVVVANVVGIGATLLRSN